MTYRHCMLDLETLGTRPGCVIRSIGAVFFDFDGKPLGPEYYANIDHYSAIALGLRVDPLVVAWWGEQSADARAALEINPHPIKAVLDGFSRFLIENGETDMLCLWSHGAGFDIPVAEAAMVLTGSIMPWKYSNCRDTRTLIWTGEQAGIVVPLERVGTQHHALDDAKTRALQMIEIHKRMAPWLVRSTSATAASA